MLSFILNLGNWSLYFEYIECPRKKLALFLKDLQYPYLFSSPMRILQFVLQIFDVRK